MGRSRVNIKNNWKLQPISSTESSEQTAKAPCVTKAGDNVFALCDIFSGGHGRLGPLTLQELLVSKERK